jgi:hypothetical protein
MAIGTIENVDIQRKPGWDQMPAWLHCILCLLDFHGAYKILFAVQWNHSSSS